MYLYLHLVFIRVCFGFVADAEGDASPVQLFNFHENQQEIQVANGKGTLTSS